MTDKDNNRKGFRLIEERKLKELNSVSRLFEHIKTGARVFHIANDDNNKLFSVAFRTPPDDSTGLPHILEHSVLCGSRKYPSKEPFVELSKGSLKTFLNALTFSDKTMYPVGSTNEKDFFNLMNVYLDAVFFPRMIDTPEILMQEGWHYEIDDAGELVYNGVVYNEMKGAFSSPDSVLRRKIQQSLFPDTTYGVESGGDPECIPDLTQEQFSAFHRKYYHPSNSFIYLYGNGDIDQQLEFLDREYLSAFDRLEIDSTITIQMPFKHQVELIDKYPVSPSEDCKEKTYLSLNYVLGRSTDPEQYLAFGILKHMLLDTPAAPLKKALIEAGIGKDVYGYFDNDLLQPVLGIVVKNSDIELKEQFKTCVEDTLRGLVKNGIDKELVEASINIREFRLREADFNMFPKGLVYNMICLDSWLHDVDPTVHLRYEPVLETIKQALTTNYFEKLIDQFILNNNHSAMLILEPEPGLVEKKAEKIKQKLAGIKAGMTERDLNEIAEKAKALKIRQQTPDPPEVLEKIPSLTLNDLDKNSEKLPLVEKSIDGIPILTHPIFTNRIGYLNLYFDSSVVPQELIPYLPLLTKVLLKIDTDKYSYGELSNLVNIHTGGISVYNDVFTEKDSLDQYYPKMVVKSKAMMSKLPKLMELLPEILIHSKFDNPKRLREIIREHKSRIEMEIMSVGIAYAMRRAMSYLSPYGKFRELVEGVSYYKFVTDLEKNFDRKVDEIVEKLGLTAETIFNRHNLTVSFTSPEEDFGEFERSFNLLGSQLHSRKPDRFEYGFELDKANEGLAVPSDVQYVIKAFNYRKLGFDYSGRMNVMSQVVDLAYLWNQVRVQGGAYGCWPIFSRNGTAGIASYRDPNLKKTLETYDNIPVFLRALDLSPSDMTRFIIGTISNLDQPLTPSMKGERAASHYFTHLSYDDVQRERDEVLSTKLADIRQFADMIEAGMKENYLSVLGSDGKIHQNHDVFGSIINVFE